MFTFNGYEVKKAEGVILFGYKLEHKGEMFSFTEKITFDVARADFDRVSPKVLSAALDTLSLILGVSYWKPFCPKDIRLPHITLSKEQAEFWNTVYTKGLGEFFYKNSIDFRGLVNFPFAETLSEQPVAESLPPVGKTLVLWGGGKDSIVSAELLKKCEKDFDLFSLNDSDVQRDTAKISEKELVVVSREIDKGLFELNKRPDAYNGHVPISFVYAATATLTALLYGYDSIIISSEESANYGNVEYLGAVVNHQWSKSYEFEGMFRHYFALHITPSITFFSLLRPYHEIKIAELFSKYPAYFKVFSSCNKNFSIEKRAATRWCGHCPKCAFVFALLAAHIPRSELVRIFGEDLFLKESLVPLYRELLGLETTKPFDCVGTPEETALALYFVHQKREFFGSPVMRLFEDNFGGRFDVITKSEEVLLVKNPHVALPKEFTHCL
ncbi:MAG: hypothetical protein Q7S86_01195 [bacterium]|nr:hypothetical protein [bacterium]